MENHFGDHPPVYRFVGVNFNQPSAVTNKRPPESEAEINARAIALAQPGLTSSASNQLWVEMWHEIGPLIPRYVARSVPREDFEDVMQNIYAVVWEERTGPGRNRWEGPDSAHYAGFVYGIARRQVLASHRKTRRLRKILERAIFEAERSVTNPAAPKQSTLDYYSSVEQDLVLVDNALSGVQPLAKEVLILQHVERYSIKEIAVLLNKTETSINSLLHRAKRTLRKKKGDTQS